MDADPIMELLHTVMTDESFRMTEEEEEALHRRLHPPLHPFSFQHWTFDVLDGGRWYRIDAKVPESEFYEGVPVSVQKRASAAIREAVDAAINAQNRGEAAAPIIHGDRTADYERALRTAFEDVRFVETDYDPDVVIA